MNSKIDHEVEYNNRARVPEHPEILAGWARDAAAFRASQPKAQLGLRYGDTTRQYLDIFPAAEADAPLALFIHGGYWRAMDPSMHSHVAAGPLSRGVTVAVAGYDLAPQVTIAQIIDQMRAACLTLWRSHKKRFAVYGHSAGGHLAACMTATNWTLLDKDAPADLVPSAYAISGVFDLTPLIPTSMNADYRLDDAAARTVSPFYWPVPRGHTLDCVVGALESAEFIRQSRAMADEWAAGEARTHYAEIPGANHFTVIAPLADPASAMTARVTELARHPQGVSRRRG
jgi:arylformamidase